MSPRPKSDSLQGSLELLALKILSRRPRLHGYAIMSAIAAISAEVLRAEEGSLYPALHRMEESGWIRAEWITKDTGRRARVYEITSTGLEQLGLEESRWESVSLAINRVLPAFFLHITPGWLETMQIPILQGSDFRPEDTAPGEAIVSETFARTFFPRQNPIGKTFKRVVGQALPYRIVALVPDTPYSNLRDPMLPVAYIPLHEVDERGLGYPISSSTFVVRTAAANPFALANTLRQTVAQRDNGLRISNVRTQAELVCDQTLRERLLAMLATFFAVVTLLLAGIGLYGVLNYSVLQRRREIGIRIAIGSPRFGIVRLVTLDVFLMILLGGCAGITLSLISARYVESLFYHVKSTDGDMLAMPALATLLTASIATLPAVLRAIRTDPTQILRPE